MKAPRKPPGEDRVVGACPRLSARGNWQDSQGWTVGAEDNCLATSQAVCSSGLPTNACMYIDSRNG